MNTDPSLVTQPPLRQAPSRCGDAYNLRPRGSQTRQHVGEQMLFTTLAVTDRRREGAAPAQDTGWAELKNQDGQTISATPWGQRHASNTPAPPHQPAETKRTFQGGNVRQGLGVGGRVQEGPRQARGEERSCGTHSSPQAAREKKITLSSQPSVPAKPPDPRGPPASPLLGFQGLLLAPGLVPRGRGIDISHGWRRHFCHGLLGSGLLVRSPSLRFPPFGPSVLEPNLSPQWKCTPHGGRKSDRRSEPVPKPTRLGPAPGLTAHLAALCGGPASSLQKISQSSAL